MTYRWLGAVALVAAACSDDGARVSGRFDSTLVMEARKKPPRPPPVPVVGVAITPGMSVDSATQANPAGTTFTLLAGTHRRQRVTPKIGNSYIGQGRGVTIVDGENATDRFVWAWNGSTWVNNVTIKKLTVTRYNSPVQDAPISGSAGPGNTSTGWVVDSVESSYNTGGVHMGSKFKLTNL